MASCFKKLTYVDQNEIPGKKLENLVNVIAEHGTRLYIRAV